MKNPANLLPVGRVLAFAKIYTNKWHNLFLLFQASKIGLAHKQ
jgi:hypothetical protein